MDKHYRVVKTVQSLGLISYDLHEFRLTQSGNTALFTAYVPRLYSSSIWVLDSIFQEVRVNDSKVLFQWSSLDHVDPSESHVARGSYSLVGTGGRADNGWDYFHINSVDKNEDGDYLISSRHTDCIYKISRHDGSILWRLGGDNSSFNLSNNSAFRRQHHARLLQDGPEQSVISLFNNDNDRFTAKGGRSVGVIIVLDHVSRTAHRSAEFSASISEEIVSAGSGSTVILDNGNILVNWGTDSFMVEFLPDGTPIWSAQVGQQTWSYRALKDAAWIGEPIQPPSLWVYAESFASTTHFYVSWNGATQVRSWRFYASDDQYGSFVMVGSLPKLDFETVFVSHAYYGWSFVEAVGIDGQSLGNSSIVQTLVPELDDGDCVLPHCSLEELDLSDNGHIWEKPAVLAKDDNGWSMAWQYMEHFMALVGMITCLVVSILILYRCRRQFVLRFSSYQQLRSQNSEMD